MLIPQAIFLLQRGQTDTQTNRQTRLNVLPTPATMPAWVTTMKQTRWADLARWWTQWLADVLSRRISVFIHAHSPQRVKFDYKGAEHFCSSFVRDSSVLYKVDFKRLDRRTATRFSGVFTIVIRLLSGRRLACVRCHRLCHGQCCHLTIWSVVSPLSCCLIHFFTYLIHYVFISTLQWFR